MGLDDAIDRLSAKEPYSIANLKDLHWLLSLEIEGNQRFIKSCQKLLAEKIEQISELVVKRSVVERQLRDLGDPGF